MSLAVAILQAACAPNDPPAPAGVVAHVPIDAAEVWSSAAHDHAEDEVAWWTCSMHPSVHEAEAGTCPICAMDLTPVTRGELESGSVRIDAIRRQRYGVRVGAVERRSLTRSIRAVGAVRWDTSLLRDVTTRTEAWIERLHVAEVGASVRRGQPLVTLYSPELYASQAELLMVRGTPLEGAARERLRLWGLLPAQIDAVLSSGAASETVTLYSPLDGTALAVDAVEGARVVVGGRLFRLAGLDRVWVEAEVYEEDLPLLDEGLAARVTLPSQPGRALEATLDRVLPWLDPTTRRGRVRLVVDNPDGALLPEMLADVALEVPLGEVVALPAEAVIYTGVRRIVFVDVGDDFLTPRDVHLGRRAGDWFEVLDGLAPGERVVTSGNFLVAAESRIRAAETYWGADHDAR